MERREDYDTDDDDDDADAEFIHVTRRCARQAPAASSSAYSLSHCCQRSLAACDDSMNELLASVQPL